jgi:hypothetical protein
MTDNEYVKWIWTDTFKELVPAVAVYVIALSAYWLFIN